MVISHSPQIGKRITMHHTQEERAEHLAKAILSVGSKTLEHVFSEELPNFPANFVKIAFINKDDDLTLMLNENPTDFVIPVEQYYNEINISPWKVKALQRIVVVYIQKMIDIGVV